MKRPRFTVLALMILVALVAVGIELWGTFVRARHFRSEAAKHSAMEQLWESRIVMQERSLATLARNRPMADYRLKSGQALFMTRTRKQMLSTIEFFRQGAAKERQLRMKYERAARHPRLPVEPDPPAPK